MPTARQFIFILLALLLTLPARAQSAVTAEAIQLANLRAGIGTDTAQLGQIVPGTRYPIIARSADFPWLLLADPASGQPLGWVFSDVVTVTGDVSGVPAYALDATWQALANGVFVPGGLIEPLAVTAANRTLSPDLPPQLGTPLPEVSDLPMSTPAAPTPTLDARVTGTAQGEINIRYGPGVEYPRIGVGRAGEIYAISAYHTQVPWVQIRYDASPNGFGWVQVDLLTYSGDRFSLPAISQTRFNLPTLTPTPSVIQAAIPLIGTPVVLSPGFAALGDQLWNQMLSAGFDPATSRLGTLFLMDLQTGEALSFGSEFAFSGMSLNKISILTALYGVLATPPNDALAVKIVEAMTCSENTSSNDLLSSIGGGSPYTGARIVTERLAALGLEHTFIAAPFTPDERIAPEPVTLPVTTADLRTDPDPSNQMTADDLGALLGSLYQCAVDERGALLTTFPDAYTPSECRQIINTMGSNRINALIEMGVPEGTFVAHKHGWIDDTHGDAGIVFTPGGNFVLVAAVHNPVWMDFGESFPLISEIARTVYNYYNPQAPLPAIREGEVSDVCTVLGNPLLEQLLSGDVALPTTRTSS
jgi:uncharacterized protein YraI